MADQEIKKSFQKMYKEYNKINNTNLKGNFRIEDRNAIITIGKYIIENGEIIDTNNNGHGIHEKEHERELEEIRNKFMYSEQFREFIKITGSTYEEQDNINWQVHGGKITVMSKQIRFKF